MSILKAKYFLIITFFISGFAHQLLYVIFPLLALVYVGNNDFTIKENRIVNLYFKFFLFIFILTIIQTIYSLDLKSYSLKGIFRYLTYLTFAIFIAQISQETINWVLKIIIWIFILMIPYGLYEAITHDRYVFIFHHANNLAYIFVLLIYFICISEEKNKIFLLSGMLFSLLLTKSSGGLLTATTILIAFFISEKTITIKNKLLLSIGIALILTAFLSLFPERISEQYKSISQINWDLILDRATKAKFGMYGSGIWRITYWIAIVNEFLKNNSLTILIGTGLDSLTLGNYIYPFMTKDPHNDYVKLIVELGALGVFFFLYFIRQLYIITNKSLLFVCLIMIPMNFGNILVNFPFMLLFITLLNYKLKTENKITEVIPLSFKTKYEFATFLYT